MEDDIYKSLDMEATAPDLMSELSTPSTDVKTPVASIRNRAAAIALMSRGDVVKNYDTISSRIADGSVEQTKIWGEYTNGVKSDSLEGMMSILGSKDYSFEEKQRLIRSSGIPNVSVSKSLAKRL